MKGNRLLLSCVAVLLFSGCAAKQKEAEGPAFMRARALEANTAANEAYAGRDFKRALDKFNESLRINRSIDNRAGELLDLINIGRTNIAIGDHEGASTSLEDAVRLALSARDEKNLSEAYATLAKADYMAGNTGAALDHLEEALAIDSRSGFKSGARLNQKGFIYARLGRYEEAASIIKAALEVNNQEGNGMEAANSHRGLAGLYARQGRDDLAMEHFARSYEIDKAHGDSKKIAHDLSGMAGLHLKAGRPEEAVFLFERSYVVNLSAGLERDAVSDLDKVVEIYKAMGNGEKTELFTKVREGLLLKNNRQGKR